jgi:acetolactate synthase-1/3 small subunit
MTISLTSDDMTFEQIKKQLNRAVEVIKVVDYTDIPIHMKELLFVKILHLSEADKTEVFRIAGIFGLTIADYAKNSILLECVQTQDKNNELIKLLNNCFCNRIEIVRGGSVAIESITK